MRVSKKSKNTLRHCGLDPQSPNNQHRFFKGFRVKRGMTDFLDSPLG